jgi:MFS family permease
VAGYVGWSLPANTLLLINGDLGNSPNIIWVSLAWTLSLAIGYAFVGRMSDIFGRRYFFMATTLLALIGTIIGATARNVNTLIGANVLNGIGAAGQLSFPIILGELIPNKQRGPANGVVFLTSMPIAVFGPIIAREFIENLAQKWRWNYYLGIVLNGIALVLFFFFYHPPTFSQLHADGKSKRRQLLEFDWVGAFLLTAGCVVFLLGLNWGGGIYPWTSAYVLAPVLTGAFVLVCFVFWEAFGAGSTPFIPIQLFKNTKFDAIVACASVGAMVSYSTSIVWPSAVRFLRFHHDAINNKAD